MAQTFLSSLTDWHLSQRYPSCTNQVISHQAKLATRKSTLVFFIFVDTLLSVLCALLHINLGPFKLSEKALQVDRCELLFTLW